MAVRGVRIEGGTQTISAGVRKTIKSIKEIVGNHSDADIYATLKETNMDPNESVQKLLHQDTFHEVRSRRNKKKENLVYKDSVLPGKNLENVGQGMKNQSTLYRDPAILENAGPDMEGHTFSDPIGERDAERSTEFRAVRNNRMNRNAMPSNISEKNSTGATLNRKKPIGGQTFDWAPNGSDGSCLRPARNANPSGNVNGRPSNSRRHNIRPDSRNSMVREHSSSSDPVHVPSLDSKSSEAIKGDVGIDGVNRQSSESVRHSSNVASSILKPILGSDSCLSTEPGQRLSSVFKGNQRSQTLSNQYRVRSRQHGHQKVFQSNKEWKPKSSNTSSAKSDLPSANNSADKSTECKIEAKELQDKLSQVDIIEKQNVFIAEHIRVAETDRCLLTFGSIGPMFEAVGSAEVTQEEPSTRLSVPSPKSSHDDISGSKQDDKQDDHIAGSGSHSMVTSVEHQFLDNKESLSSQNLNSYADIGMVAQNNQLHAPAESQQQQEATELPILLGYDPQAGYDIPYFRPTVEESLQGQSQPYNQEAFTSYAQPSIPASTIPMMQQQQQQTLPMYPQQVHVSHFANLMPYRQFLSPVYVPPMGMPGYSNNTLTYPPHPSNGSTGYVIMPGGNSHPNAANIKYGVQQFKPYPSVSPTGFENFIPPIGYNMNTRGVGTTNGVEDSSILQYKDGAMYVSNPQAEQSQMWNQSSRELQGMQSTPPYYNMMGQTPQDSYFAPHTGRANFNGGGGPAQSSHMQFSPGMYHHHPQQPTPLPQSHHLVSSMAGNVAAAAPGPQMSHFNWITNS